MYVRRIRGSILTVGSINAVDEKKGQLDSSALKWTLLTFREAKLH
jgi:hypothetical protein